MPVSVVTGAGSGIGAATARVLGERGDQVVCADLDGAAAERTASELPGAVAVQTGVSAPDACEDLVGTALSRFGRIDVMVTCAGIEVHGPSVDFPIETFDKIIGVNLRGTYLCARAAAKAMIARGEGGSIVLIGSINSIRANPGAAAYCASKGAVLMLGRALAIEWAEHGIRVNIIGPGVVNTPMSARSLADPERRARLMAKTPLRRPADPAEIGRIAAFLSTPAASFMTGAYVPVDGGSLAGS